MSMEGLEIGPKPLFLLAEPRFWHILKRPPKRR
jgi:hypothetical protein